MFASVSRKYVFMKEHRITMPWTLCISNHWITQRENHFSSPLRPFRNLQSRFRRLKPRLLASLYVTLHWYNDAAITLHTGRYGS